MVEEKKVIEKGSVDLVISDAWRVLNTGKAVKGLTPEKRDKYIKKVQKDLVSAYECLKLKKDGKANGGNMLIGCNVFSMTSFGDDIFKKDFVKRALVWFKEQDDSTQPLSSHYRDASEWFLWAVAERNWTFNLLDGEKMYDSEFRTDESDENGALKVAKEMVLRFSNEGDKVMVVNDYQGSVLKQAIEETGRVYISAVRGKEGEMLHA